MRPYNPYSNYLPGYNPCLEAAGYNVYNQQPLGEGETTMPMPGTMPGMMPNPNMMPMPGMMPGMMPNPNMMPMPGMMPGMMPNPNMMPMPGTMPGTMPGSMPMCSAGAVPYTVEEGDTLYSIARMYGTTVADILAANPSITESSMLYIGQMLCVPMPTPCHGQKYTVQAGDTYYTISRKYGVTVNDLMAANPGIPANNLLPGMVICIPAPVMKQCPTGSMSYTVVAGDTLTTIADRFSVSVYALTVANPGFSAENLMPGMRLCIAPFACMPSCVESERYTIAEGEDLMKIAEKFQVSTDDLLRTNPFAPPCWFTPGNMICLPSNATPIAPARRR